MAEQTLVLTTGLGVRPLGVRGEPLHNHLDPSVLNDLERRVLREALRQARSLQSRLTRDFAVASASFGA